MRIREVVNALEQFAPLPLQEDYDNAGLQIGLTETEVSGALLCLDVTEDIIVEAVARGCNLVVAHHPLIFRRLAHITGEDHVQRTVALALRRGVAVVAMHTNLDVAPGGVACRMAAHLGLSALRPLGKTREMPGGGEPASEGVMGLLPGPVAADDFIALLKREFRAECVQANQLLRRPIRSVALCGGAGSGLLGAAVEAGADAFVTGEMSYHQYFGHEQQIQIATLGHYQSEQFTVDLLADLLARSCPGLRCERTAIDTNPILCL